MQQDLITGTRFFGASVMVILALVVAFMSRGRSRSRAYDSARWLLVAGTMMLGVHNIVQFVGHYRECSVGTAWAVNLAFFCVTCPAYNLAEMHLLRMDKRVWQMTWLTLSSIMVVYVLCAAGYATGTLVNDSAPMASVLTVAAAVITATLLVQDYYLCRAFAASPEGMNETEERDRSRALRYTSASMKCLMASALLTPWSGMYGSLAFHALFGLFMFVAMVWHLANFLLYGRNMAESGPQGEGEPEEHNGTLAAAPAVQTAVDNADRYTSLEQTASRVERWIGEKHYTDPDLKMETALGQMGVSLPRLNFYIENVAKVKGYRQWISSLRIDYAKEMMLQNPNYTLDAIAGMCGFANRRSLTNVFKAQTGVSPSQWADSRKEARGQ